MLRSPFAALCRMFALTGCRPVEPEQQVESRPVAAVETLRGRGAPAQTVEPARRGGAEYRVPAQDVVDVVDAPPTPRVSPNVDGSLLALASYDPLPSIAAVSRPFLRLAGVRIDAERAARRRTTFYTGLSIVTVADGTAREVSLPAGSRLGRPVWSPDGRHVALTRAADTGDELWVIATQSGEAKRLGEVHVTDVLDSPFTWMPGSQALLARTVPAGRPAPPAAPSVPSGPMIVDTAGKAAQNRTYQDLLTSAHDEASFEHYATTQLTLVTLEGAVQNLGAPDMIAESIPSPDGNHLLVVVLRRPFSYAVPYSRFARRMEVWDAAGQMVHRLADLDVADEVPIQGVPTGVREPGWQPLQDATLVWAEALDGGDPRTKADHRDKLMTLAAPFSGQPAQLLRMQHRFSGTDWLDRPGEALITEYDRDRRWLTTRLHDLGSDAEPRVVFDRSSRDRYGDPGRPVKRERPDGTHVVIVEDGWIYLSGTGATPNGDQPFLDRRKLVDGQTERLFSATEERYARFAGFSGSPKERRLIVSYESPTEAPNYHLVHGTATPRALTTFADPHPQLTGIEKRLLKYKRRDGVPLSGTLYVPPGHAEGTRLPLVVWAYPLEYNDRSTAGQVRAAPNRFTRLRSTSPLMFLTRGYAVLDGAAMPVVGDPETMNDTFVRQIVDAAKAAIDAAVAEGVADRERVAVAGHSYGAFMTANLLAHSDLFRAGIARSGAYNRTLTPFGFQSERRTLWEAPQTYMKVSPLFAADGLDEPILLIHGEVDNNSGTFPLQSRRLFHALSGLGGTARLVVLPHESHGYAARESVLHVLAESFDWLDEHVKNAKGSGM